MSQHNYDPAGSWAAAVAEEQRTQDADASQARHAEREFRRGCHDDAEHRYTPQSAREEALFGALLELTQVGAMMRTNVRAAIKALPAAIHRAAAIIREIQERPGR